MSAHRALFDMFSAPFLMTDPGASGTITVNRWGAVVPIVTATAEARTLAQPTKAGLLCLVELDATSGDCTLTVTGGYNQAAATSITLDTAGDWILFASAKIGASYYWRVVSHSGTSLTETGGGTVTSQTITTLGTTTLTATNANIGREQVATTTVNAAGSAIGNAGALSYGRNLVLLADNTVGVILPVAVANGTVEVIQSVNAKQLAVYPQVNSTIAGLAASVALNTGVANTAAQAGTAQNVYFKFVATNATQWYVSK
jgi:hypothetical protein